MAQVSISWALRGVEEVVPDVEMEGSQELEHVEDTHQGMQMRSARMRCFCSGCSGSRSCMHTRHVSMAYGYLGQPTVSAHQQVIASLDERLVERRLRTPCVNVALHHTRREPAISEL